MKKILFKNFFLNLIAIIFITSAYADDKMNLGLEVFNNKAMCGTCHILEASESKGDIGPNLDLLKPPIDRIIYVVKNGIGVMQSWEGILTEEEIEAVAYYIFNSTNN
tara:strand:+ start:510 stop:830 length:321 start_codon:yes stop_codon:yes gene_type:complete